jgi:hypothetical protein
MNLTKADGDVHKLPPDTYHFRIVLTNILQLPCVFAWWLALFFVFGGKWPTWVLGLVFGFATSYLVAWLLFLLGRWMIACADRWYKRKS